MNIIDLAAATELGVIGTNMSDADATTIMELAMAVSSVSEPLTDELLQQLCALSPVPKAIQINL